MKPTKEQQRQKRHAKIRKNLAGTSFRPRLVVNRSLNAIYAQLVDDSKGITLSSSPSLKSKSRGMQAAKEVGAQIAKAALVQKIEACVFDRGGYLYHGRIKALAEAAREAGLRF